MDDFSFIMIFLWFAFPTTMLALAGPIITIGVVFLALFVWISNREDHKQKLEDEKLQAEWKRLGLGNVVWGDPPLKK